jgi:hypothetical protein
MFIGSINITSVKDIKHSKNNYTIGIDDVDNNDINNKSLIESFNLPYKIHFYASNVCSLEDFINTNSFTIYTANKMLISIYNQLYRLYKQNLYVSFFDINDIIVIDSHYFFFCNANKLYHSSDETLHISDIYDKNSIFIPPEFKLNNKMPFIIHKNTAFYSLAIIVLYSMKKTNCIFHHLSCFEILDYYKSTKMYSILKMCIVERASDRHFVMF